MRFFLRACVIVSLLRVSVLAQTPSQIRPETYGTSSLTWVTLTPWDFHPLESSTTYSFTIAGMPTRGIFSLGGSDVFVAGLRLPEGAVVSALAGIREGALLTEIQYQVCDLNPGNPMYASLWTLTATGNTFNYINMTPITSGGCGLFSHTYTPPVQIDNNGFTYGIELYVPVASANQRITTARVGYKLQVSPAPATATFTDVPTTHLFYQYVEALAAAGITAGCGGGNFCPDAAVTRGQMAVFLSKALGLHWAP